MSIAANGGLRSALAWVGLAILCAAPAPADANTEGDRIRSIAASRYGDRECTNLPVPLVSFTLNDVVRNVRLYSTGGPTRTRCVFVVAGAEIFEVVDIPSFNRFLRAGGISVSRPEQVSVVVRSYMELTRLGAADEYGIISSAAQVPFFSPRAEERRRELARRFALHPPTVVLKDGVFEYEYFEWWRSTATLSLVHASVGAEGLLSVRQVRLAQWIDEATLIM